MAQNLRDRGFSSSMDGYNQKKKKEQQAPVSTQRAAQLPKSTQQKPDTTAQKKQTAAGIPVSAQRMSSAANGRAAAAYPDKLSEQEFNRSTAMQKSYGNYNNYLLGRRVTPGGFTTKPDTANLLRNTFNLYKQAENRYHAAWNNLAQVSNEIQGIKPLTFGNPNPIPQNNRQSNGVPVWMDQGAQQRYQAAQHELDYAAREYQRTYDGMQSVLQKQQELDNQWRSSIRSQEEIQQNIDENNRRITELNRAREQSGQETALLLNENSMRSPDAALRLQQALNKKDEAGRIDKQIEYLRQDNALLQEELEWSHYFKWLDMANNELPVSVRRIQGKPHAIDKIIMGNYTDEDVLQAVNEEYFDPNNVKQLSREERETYRKLYEIYGPEKAREYYDELDTLMLNSRRQMAEEQSIRDMMQDNPAAAIGLNILSVLSGPLKVFTYANQAGEMLLHGKLTQDASYNQFSYLSSAVRDETSRQIGEKLGDTWGKFGVLGYQTAISMADFLYNAGITGGFSGGGENLSLLLMGSEAAADATMQAKDRGLPDGKAFALGTIAGIAEIFTEKVSLETLLDKLGTKNGWQYFLKNFVAEGSEEVGSDLINLMADIWIAKDQSEWRTTIRSYMKDGLTEQEAFNKAWLEQAGSIVQSFAGGALSGGAMAGGMLMLNYNANRQQMREVMTSPDYLKGIIEQGKLTGEGTRAYELAERLEGKLEDGRHIGLQEVVNAERAAQKALERDMKDRNAEALGQRLISTEYGREALAQEIQLCIEGDINRALAQTVQEQMQNGEEIVAKDAGKIFLAAQKVVDDYQSQQQGRETRTLTPREVTADMTELEKSAARAGVSERDTARMQRTADALGREVRFYNRDAESYVRDGKRYTSTQNGYYDRESGIIYVNAQAKNPFMQVVSHELTHNLEGTESYGALQEMILGRLENLDQRIQDKIESYARQGVNLDEDGAKYELTAEYVENTLLGDERTIRETVRKNRSLGEWVRDQIDRILAKLGNAEEQAAAKERQELRRIRDLYAQALRERSENKETAADSQRDGEQYSIEELEDGTKFVEVNTDQHLFDGMTGHEMQAEVQRMINYRLKNTNFDTEVGTKYTALLGERTAGEYTHPRKRVPHNAFIAKLKASTELDNLLDASRYIAHKADDGHHPEATGGWDYYSTLFRVNGQMYRGRINIEITDDGPIFYNVTHIQRTQKGTTGNFVGTQPRAASPESSGGAGENISQDEPEVKDLSLPAEGAVQSSLTEEAEGVKDLSLPKVGDVQYSFASEEANTANNDLLDTAKDLETRGVSSEEIRRSTGWFRGMDGKWRFEIDDSGMSVKLPEYAFNRLRDLIRHDALFEAYPDLKDVEVYFTDEVGENEAGYYDRNLDRIVINKKYENDAETIKRILLHEIQHAIQDREGLARGATEEYWDAARERGYDTRTKAQRAQARDLWQEFDEIRQREPEFWQEMADLLREAPTVPRGKVLNWDTLESEPDPQEWVDFDQRRDALQEKYGTSKVFGFMRLWDSIFEAEKYDRGTSSHELYRNTAGEIEARDSDNRRDLTAEERRNTRPDIDRENVVFAPARFSMTEEEDGPDGLLLPRLDDSRQFSLTEYSNEQKEIWKNSKRIIVYENRQQLNAFIHNALEDRQSNKKMYFGAIPADLAESIRLNTGLNVEGYNCALSGDTIRKIIKDHGDEVKEKNRNQRAITDEDFALIPDVLQNATKIARSYYYNKGSSPIIRFAADDVKGITVVARVSKGHLDLAVQTMYAKNNKDLSTPSAEQAANNTPEASHGTVLAENSIAQGEPVVKDLSLPKADDGKYQNSFTEEETTEVKDLGLPMIGEPAQQSTEEPEVKDLGLPKIGDEETEEPKKPKTRKKPPKPVAESKPIMARSWLNKKIIDSFGIRENKTEASKIIQQYADKVLREGAVTDVDVGNLFGQLYDRGVFEIFPDSYSKAMRELVTGGNIYTTESVKAEFGDDWADFRRKAFDAGLMLTNTRSISDAKTLGVDQIYKELSDMSPGLFPADEYDQRAMLEKIVQAAENGKSRKMTLPEYLDYMNATEGQDMFEAAENMMDKIAEDMRAFGEMAGLEIKLRDRTGVKIAQERERFGEIREKHFQRISDARAQERERFREIQQRARERKQLSELRHKYLKSLQWLKKNQFRAPEELQDTWNELLGDMDLYAVFAAKETGMYDEEKGITIGDALNIYAAAKETENFLPSTELEKLWARVHGEHVGDLDIDELQARYQAITALRTEFYNRNRVLGEAENMLFSDVYDGVQADMARVGRQVDGKTHILRKMMNDEMLTPMNMLRRMVGWNKNSTFVSMARQLEQGERTYRRFKEQAAQLLDRFMQENADWVRKADGTGKDGIWHTFEVPELLAIELGNRAEYGETVTIEMTPLQLVQLYLESKSYDNLRHIAKGGRTFADRALWQAGNKNDGKFGKTVKLSPETVKGIVKTMTPQEMELAKLLEHYYNVWSKPQINRVSNALDGFDKAMTGAYAPMHVNQDVVKQEIGTRDIRAKSVPNMKSRIKGAVAATFNTDALEAWQQSVEDSAKYVGYAIPERNWNCMMNYWTEGRMMRDVIRSTWGSEGVNYITKTVENLLSRGDRSGKFVLGESTSKLLSNYIAATFGANPGIVLKQSASLPQFAAILGWNTLPSPKQIARINEDVINAYTSELAYRKRGYATPETAQLKNTAGKLKTNKVLNFTFGGGAIIAMDAATVRTSWAWAENYVKRNFPELSMGTDEQIRKGESEFYKKVAEIFEDAVNTTQPMYDEMHRAGIMKDSNGIMRAFTMFKTVPLQQYNTLRRLFGELSYAQEAFKADASEENKAALRQAQKGAANAVTATVGSVLMLEAVELLNALWKNRGKKYRDDEDKLTAGSIAGNVALKALQDTAGMVIGGKELTEWIGNLLTGKKWYGIEIPGGEQLNDFIDTIGNAAKGINNFVAGGFDVIRNGENFGLYLKRHAGEYAGAAKELAEKTAMYFGGLPLANVEKYILGGVQFFPEISQAVENVFTDVKKDDLKGKTGGQLQTSIKDLFDVRGVKLSDEDAKEIARLYEGGFNFAAPADTPKSITVDGEAVELSEAQRQKWEREWARYGSEITKLMQSEQWNAADDEERRAILNQLYALGREKANTAVMPEHEAQSWVAKADVIMEAGATASETAGWIVRSMDMNNAEKFALLAEERLEDQTKEAIFGTIVGTEMETEEGNPSRWAKYQTFKKSGATVTDYAKWLSETAGMKTEEKYRHLAETDLNTAAKVGIIVGDTGTELETPRGNETEFAKFLRLWNEGLSVDDYCVLKSEDAVGIYDRVMDRGVDINNAVDTALMVHEVKETVGEAATVMDYCKYVTANIYDKSRQMDVLAGIMQATEYSKLKAGVGIGLEPKYYFEAKQKAKILDDNGSINQAEASSAVSGMSCSTEQKAMLWQMFNKSWKAGKNPFSSTVGQQVYNALHEEETPKDETYDPYALSLPG